MADHDDKTIGQRIDAVLAPYLKDKADLQARLERDLAQRQRLDTQIQATKRDLQIVESTMTQALREAAKRDPILATVFSLAEPREAPRSELASATAPTPPGRSSRSHPLLNPTA